MSRRFNFSSHRGQATGPEYFTNVYVLRCRATNSWGMRNMKEHYIERYQGEFESSNTASNTAIVVMWRVGLARKWVAKDATQELQWEWTVKLVDNSNPQDREYSEEMPTNCSYGFRSVSDTLETLFRRVSRVVARFLHRNDHKEIYEQIKEQAIMYTLAHSGK